MQATWIDGRVLDWLAERPEGRVHSLFQKVCNLAWGERLITLALPTAGRLPGGITVSTDDWPMLVGDLVRFDGRGLQFPQAHLAFTNAFVETEEAMPLTSVDTGRLLSNLVTAVRLARLSGKGDLLPLLGACPLAFGFAKCPSEEDLRAWQELRSLARALAEGDGPALVAAARPLLGRGQGLTPAWDDLLLGFQAVTWFAGPALPPASRAALGELSDYLALEAPRRTTSISANYLYLAAKGGYSERLATAARSLLQAQGPALVAPLQQLFAFGHTSGHDTAVGLILGGATVLHLSSFRGGN